MSYIWKSFTFSAAHHLPLMPEGHRCRGLHGHTYRVEVWIGGPIRPDGIIVDYADIATAWEPLRAQLDHVVLNEVEGLSNPTTELLAKWIWDHWRGPHLIKVVVQEGPDSGCSYSGRYDG